jgi:DNA-directed RNA polymerase subunit RPC12/RpoP
MIKFHCSVCNKKLGVPDSYAGKRVKCPQCGSPIEVAQPRPDAVPVGVEDLLAGPDFGIWSDEILTAAAEPKPKKVRPIRTCKNCNAAISEGTEFCPVCSAQIAAKAKPLPQKPPTKLKTFWYDLLKLLSPVSSLGDGINFFILFILNVYSDLPLPGILLGSSRLVVGGYIYAYLFNVLLEAADGNNGLPDFHAISSLWEDCIRPAWLFSYSMFYACLPAYVITVVCVFLLSPGIEPVELFSGRSIIIAIFAGLFFWPMVVLNIALGDSFLVRPDKVFLSIIRMFIPYLIACFWLYVSAILIFLSFTQYPVQAFSDVFTVFIFVTVVELVVQIYAMRVIGLLYRHYREHLDW